MSDESEEPVTRKEFEQLRGKVHATAAIATSLLQLKVLGSSDPAKALALMRENHRAMVAELDPSTEFFKFFSHTFIENFDELEIAINQRSDSP